MQISIGCSLAPGTGRLSTESGGSGPLVLTPPSVLPSTAQTHEESIVTQGTYAPRGGGTVSITRAEFLLDGAMAETGTTYVPTEADLGKILSYVEEVTETGGASPGYVTRIIVIGPVTERQVSGFDASGVMFDQTMTSFDQAA